MEKKNTNEALALVSKEFGLSPQMEAILQERFADFVTQAEEWKKLCDSMAVTSEDQTEDMQKAREARLILKDMRVKIEKTRKELKDESLQTGRAIDKAANWLKDQIEPTEKAFEAMEKFAENAKKEREGRILAERKAALDKWGFDSTGFDLIGMPEESFQTVLKAAQAAFEQREAEAKAKAQREIEEAEAKRVKFELGTQRRFRLENYGIVKTWEEAAEMADFDEVIEAAQKRKLADEAQKAEEKRIADEAAEKARANEKAAKEKAAKEKADSEAKKAKLLRRIGALQFIGGHSGLSELEALTDDQFEVLRAEKQTAWDAEKKKRAEAEAETKRLKEKEAEAEAKRKKQAAEDRKAAKAPDKSKILAWLDRMEDSETPDCKTEDGREFVRLEWLNLKQQISKVRKAVEKEFE